MIKVNTISVNTDNGKQTVDSVTVKNNVYIDFNRTVEMLELDKKEVIDIITMGALLYHDGKVYANSCNLIRLYNNLNHDRAFYRSMIQLSSKAKSEKSIDKLQLTRELYESLILFRSSIDSLKGKKSKLQLYDSKQEDILHDVENDMYDDFTLKDLNACRYRRRKYKNEIYAIESLDEVIVANKLSKVITQLKQNIEVNANKIYIRRCVKNMPEIDSE